MQTRKRATPEGAAVVGTDSRSVLSFRSEFDPPRLRSKGSSKPSRAALLPTTETHLPLCAGVQPWHLLPRRMQNRICLSWGRCPSIQNPPPHRRASATYSSPPRTMRTGAEPASTLPAPTRAPPRLRIGSCSRSSSTRARPAHVGPDRARSSPPPRNSAPARSPPPAWRPPPASPRLRACSQPRHHRLPAAPPPTLAACSSERESREMKKDAPPPPSLGVVVCDRPCSIQVVY
jgi:hypothetical protein